MKLTKKQKFPKVTDFFSQNYDCKECGYGLEEEDYIGNTGKYKCPSCGHQGKSK